MATILVVDDRPINREFLVTLLGYLDHEVLQASDGAEALALAGSRRPHLVITDVLMPVMDGVELVKRLRADPPTADIPVIFYTATYRLGDARNMAQDCGVDTVIGKPASPQAIIDAVAAKLGRPEQSPPKQLATAPGLLGGSGHLFAWMTDLPPFQQYAHATEGQSPIPDTVPQTEVLHSLNTVTALSLRLAALLELGLEMGAEHDIDRLLEVFIGAARNIVGAQYAAVGVLGETSGIGHLAARGLPAESLPSLAAHGTDGLLGRLLVDGKAQRLTGGAPAPDGLPAGHPPVHGVLALPLRSLTRSYGWLYFASKREANSFTDEDEQLAGFLAAKLALACENMRLFDEVKSYAGELEIEVAARRQNEDRIARLNRVLAVLSGINSAIVRIHQRQELFEEACRIAFEIGQFKLAWIGRAKEGRLTPQVWRASGGTTPQAIPLDVAAAIDHAVLGSGHVTVCNDLIRGDPDDPNVTTNGAAELPPRSRAILSLRENGTTAGAMVLYAGEAGFFDDAEVRLLDELAGDLSFALDYIARGERLNYLAYYDILTGLPNRNLFIDRLAQLLHGASRDGSTVAVILLDIDHYKRINDRLGRHIGDALLKQLAERLLAQLEETGTLARVGADIFAIAAGALPAGDDAMAVLRDKVFAALLRPFPANDGELELTARAGLALFPGDGDSADVLLSHAEMALGQAKASGEPHCYFDPEVNERITARMSLEAELRLAVRRNEFTVHYQPKMSLYSGQIVGAEALVRWQHPERGLIGPAGFIPVAEECGLIGPIGEWILRDVCAQQALWQADHLDIVPVAVNLSVAQFRGGQIVDRVRAALAETPLDARHLELELTESILINDPDGQGASLEALRKLGVGLSLDDFGTGYSSLAYLKRFPFSCLKIDRAFITDITRNPEDAAIADAAIGIAKRLGMRTVAEGVETEGQMRYLCGLGCDEMQGYYFSPPVPAGEFAAMLRSGAQMALQPAAPQNDRTLLLVDDEPNILSALQRLLRRDGYSILTAGSGFAALDLLAVNDVQVIISDQRMVGMSGAELMSVVKELYPDTIRIILSGFSEVTAITDAVNHGAVFKFLTKPWDDELLRDNVRDAFRRYRPRTAP